MLRVIAGTLKGRRLEVPDWEGLRPTSERLRGTIFDVLADRSAGASFLDGCAGTGALGIEALSRGARRVDFVDDDLRATELVSRNLDRCGITTQATVVYGSLPEVGASEMVGQPYDVVLLDPPYDETGIGAILSSIVGVLALTGVLVLERSKRVASTTTEGLLVTRSVIAGDSALDFYCLDNR